MDLRLVVSSLLFTVATAAQAVEPATPAAPAAQDPDKKVVTPADERKQLETTKVQLQTEIEYARNRAKDAKALLRSKFAGTPRNWKAIDAGVSTPPAPAVVPAAPQPIQTAKVASKEELGSVPQDTLVIVDGRPVGQASYDRLMTYLRGLPNSGDDAMRSERAMMELIRIESIAARFEEHEVMERASDLIAQLQNGKPFAELVKAAGVLRGAGEDGKVEITHNSMFGPMVEMIAFETPAGQTTRPFRNAYGLVVLAVDKVEKGASPELDKVIGTALQLAYGEDATLQKAEMAIATGQVRILARDEATLKLLPRMFQPMANQPGMTQVLDVENATAQAMQTELAQLEAELTRLQGKTDAAAVARTKALQERLAELKKVIEQAGPGAVRLDDTTDGAVVPPKKEAPVKKD